jgi:hypothetical protein
MSSCGTKRNTISAEEEAGGAFSSRVHRLRWVALRA